MSNIFIERAAAVENLVADELREIWGISFNPTTRYHCADFILYRNGIRCGVVEVKERHIASDAYNTAVFELAKAQKILKCADNLPAFLIFVYEDCTLWHRLNPDLSGYRRRDMRVTTPLSGNRSQRNILINSAEFCRLQVIPPEFCKEEVCVNSLSVRTREP